MGGMKKIILSTITVIAFLAYGFYQRSKDAVLDTLGSVSSSSSSSSAVSSSSSSNTNSTSSAASSTTSTVVGMYKDGTYTGVDADAFYGIVQVQVTVSNGAITDVVFLSYPSDRSTSRQINSRAMPILKSETIAAQSANVRAVSGASDTSQAFIESLSSALSQAKS